MSSRFLHGGLISIVSNATKWQFVRFVLVGGAFAGLYVALATILTSWLYFSYWAASGSAYLLMILPAYMAQKKLAFQSSANDGNALPRYLALQLASLFAASSSAHLLSANASLNPVLVYIISAGITIMASFLLIKFWVLADEKL